MKSLSRTANRLVAIVLLATAAALFAGCGGNPPPVSTFDAFKSAVNRDQYDRAWGMLTPQSQARIGNQQRLQELVNGPLKEVFENGRVRNPRFEGSERNAAVGDVFIYGSGGGSPTQASVGRWTVLRDGNNWQIEWTLSTGAGDGGGAPVE